MKNKLINIAIASCFALSTTLVQAVDSQTSQKQDRNMTNETTAGGTWIGKPGSSGETGLSQSHDHTALNDAQIAQILVTLNKIDIENGAIAKKSTKDNEVFAFASRMVKEHAEVLKQANELIKKLNLHPDDSAVSKSLETEAEQNLSKLKFFSDNTFENNYVNAEITLHQKFIDIVDIHLITNVKNEELKGMLVNVRHVLVSHLEHAQKIHSAIGSKKM